MSARSDRKPVPIAGRHIIYTYDQKAYDFIVQFKTDHDGIAPTLREICDNVGISSTSVCSNVLRRLEKRGLVLLWDEVSRGIKVVGGVWQLEGKVDE